MTNPEARQTPQNIIAELVAENMRLTRMLCQWYIMFEETCDKGTAGEGWQSEELMDLKSATKATFVKLANDQAKRR